MNTSETLHRAADLIEERGWVKGMGWVYEGDTADQPLCLEGGIMAALGMKVRHDEHDTQFTPLLACPAYRAVSDYLGRVPASANICGFEGQPLYWWNDEVPQNATEVIEVLRAAALIEAAREQDAAFATYEVPAEVTA